MHTDIYLTIKQSVETEFKEKGSRFIGRAFPVKDREQAEEIIKSINKKHYDATHNCFAWCIGIDNEQITRFNDDGEPSGTAGKPILQTIEGKDLTNTLIIVTRYFGGTKLGTGGLARAYSQSAGMALEATTIIKNYILEPVNIQYDYSLSNLVNTLIQKYKCQIDNTEYQEDVIQTISIRKGMVKSFTETIIDQSAGNVSIIK